MFQNNGGKTVGGVFDTKLPKFCTQSQRWTDRKADSILLYAPIKFLLQ